MRAGFEGAASSFGVSHGTEYTRIQVGQRYLPLTGHIGLGCIIWHHTLEKEVQRAFIHTIS
jgi:hypothetical protein